MDNAITFFPKKTMMENATGQAKIHDTNQRIWNSRSNPVLIAVIIKVIIVTINIDIRKA